MQLLVEIFIEYKTTTSPLIFTTCRATNGFFIERALSYWSSMSAHVFGLGLTLLPITLFQCWNWWEFSYRLKILHPLLYSPPIEPQTNLYRESFATLKFKVYSCFLDKIWLFCLPLCFGASANETKFCSVWNYYIPSCIPHLQSHKQILWREFCYFKVLCLLLFFRSGSALQPTMVF